MSAHALDISQGRCRLIEMSNAEPLPDIDDDEAEVAALAAAGR